MEFFRLYRNAPDIVRADGSAFGTASSRALKYCEAFTAASRLGWYVFPPLSFSLMWTGSEVVFRLNDEDEDSWHVLDRFFIHDFVDEYIKVVPENVSDCYPPFLDLFVEGNIVQIWSGYALRGREGYCHQVRGPINLPLGGNYQVYEGLIDSSWYVSPLVSNIKIIKQDIPIYFPRHMPYIQVIPMPVEILSSKKMPSQSFEIDTIPNDFWQSWYEVYRDRNSGQPGSYARKQRKRSAQY